VRSIDEAREHGSDEQPGLAGEAAVRSRTGAKGARHHPRPGRAAGRRRRSPCAPPGRRPGATGSRLPAGGEPARAGRW